MNRIKKSFCLISFLLYIFFINCSIVKCEEALSEDIIFSRQVSQKILEKEKKKLLKLEKIYNARDLGGIKTPDGFFTKYKVFVRSDNTDELSDQDITYLKNYGIKTVIDLRSENEIKNFPDKLRNVKGIDWYNVDIKKGNKMSRKLISDNDYIELVKYTGDGNSQKKLFDLIANLKEGTVLFHCAAGKDRTGVLAMLLLKLVGASDEDIVDNYSVSFDLIKNRPSIRMIMENSIKNMESK